MKKSFLHCLSFAILLAKSSWLSASYIDVDNIRDIIAQHNTPSESTVDVAYDFDGTFVDSSVSLNNALLKYGDPRTKTNSTLFYTWLNGQGLLVLGDKCKILESVRMHLDRGDRIHFISSREDDGSGGVLNKVKARLKKRLSLLYPQPEGASNTTYHYYNKKVDSQVVDFSFTNHGKTITKQKLLQKHNVTLYYGDSDDEKQASIDVGVTFIRVLRSDSDTMNFIEPNTNIDIESENVLSDSHLGLGIYQRNNPIPVCVNPSIPKNKNEAACSAHNPTPMHYYWISKAIPIMLSAGFLLEAAELLVMYKKDWKGFNAGIGILTAGRVVILLAVIGYRGGLVVQSTFNN